MAVTHTSEIRLTVSLDENNIPEQLKWSAQDSDIENEEASALMLSVWDSKNKESLKIDLWTKEMSIHEMKIFFYQSLMTMSDSFMKATQDEKMTAAMKDFCAYFAENLELK